MPNFNATFLRFLRIQDEANSLIENVENTTNATNARPSFTSATGKGKGRGYTQRGGQNVLIKKTDSVIFVMYTIMMKTNVEERGKLDWVTKNETN